MAPTIIDRANEGSAVRAINKFMEILIRRGEFVLMRNFFDITLTDLNASITAKHTPEGIAINANELFIMDGMLNIKT
jgi:hypothetical protein